MLARNNVGNNCAAGYAFLLIIPLLELSFGRGSFQYLLLCIL
uniref:Uncharacterized protein n=1 Tax=Rhizophora mucronata TaxID=61149 RepID=A0A2P2PHN2_RHIMU